MRTNKKFVKSIIVMGWINFKCGIHFEQLDWGLDDFYGRRKSVKIPKTSLAIVLLIWTSLTGILGMWHKHKTVECNFHNSNATFIVVLQQSLLFFPPRRLRRVIKKRCKLWWAQVWGGRQIGGVKNFAVSLPWLYCFQVFDVNRIDQFDSRVLMSTAFS